MTQREELIMRYKNLPPDKKPKFINKLLEIKKENNELNKEEFDKLFNVNAAIVSIIAAKNNISIERMIYDLSSSWNKTQQIYPSESPIIENDYEQNIPIEKEINEPELNSFKNKILLEFELLAEKNKDYYNNATFNRS